MLNELLQERAALYAAGTMTAPEREQFELVLEFHEELRALVGGLADAAAAITLGTLPADGAAPSSELKARILAAVADRPQQTVPAGLVVTGPDGFVQWVSPAFTAMCGYSLDELSGKKLGPILQGEKTDHATAVRMREAVQAHRSCRETILNYHKDGTPYWVEISITPILDDAGQPLWLIAREHELPDRAAA